MVADFDFGRVEDFGRLEEDLADFGRTVRFFGEGPTRAPPAANGPPDGGRGLPDGGLKVY